MMDPYNLAICFGPTLVPIPTDRDQVQFQNLVNELIKNFIIFHEDIFPNDSLGVVYEKYISSEPDDVQEYGNDDITANEEDFESEVTEDGEFKPNCGVHFGSGFNIDIEFFFNNSNMKIRTEKLRMFLLCKPVLRARIHLDPKKKFQMRRMVFTGKNFQIFKNILKGLQRFFFSREDPDPN